MSSHMRMNEVIVAFQYFLVDARPDCCEIYQSEPVEASVNLDAINEWGSVVALTYIGAQRVFPDYNDMADAKAMLESVARNFGYHYGVRKKVRINTISQSPTPTTAGAGVKGFDDFIAFADAMSPLGNARAEDCANYCVSLFSDLTKFVTMQNLFHDGGFSSTGMSESAMAKMNNIKYP